MRRYNLSLAGANLLFALNFSFFVAVLEREALGLGEIFALQNLLMLLYVALWWIGRAVGVGSVNLVGDRRQERVLERGKVPTARDAVAIGAISLLSALGWSYALLVGVAKSSPLDGATIASVGPSLTLIFAHFMRRRRLTTVRLAGVVVSLVGVAVLISARSWARVVGAGMWGIELLVVAVSVAALNTLLFKPYLERYGLLRVATIYAVVSSAASLLLFGGQIDLTKIATESAWGVVEIVALLSLGGALPLFMLFEGSEYLTPLHTSLYRYLQPFVTTIVVVVRGQATLSAANYVALAALVVGAWMIAKGAGRSD